LTFYWNKCNENGDKNGRLRERYVFKTLRGVGLSKAGKEINNTQDNDHPRCVLLLCEQAEYA
jgi:hypothetical protein